ncbi:MAG TPA: hypothetical protein VFF69_06725 [Phycisphaerales bacterium]|nr:hypothetical protein [Phycisphaerales bacterium]
MPQQIAAAFALCAFVVAIGAGLANDVAAPSVLRRSLVVLVVGYPTGRALGAALGAALNEHLTAIASANPLPEPVRLSAPIGGAGRGDVEIIDDVESL